MTVCALVFVWLTADRAVEGVEMPAPALAIRRESKQTPPEKPDMPARADDRFLVDTDLGPFEVTYSRYLNRPPFAGRHAACPTSDWGLGVPGLQSHWYRGNTIRVLLDGEDIVAAWAADAIQTRQEPDVARLRFSWTLDLAEVTVTVVVLNGRSEGFVETQVRPRRRLRTLGLHLTCYPGGYGPYYGFPSRRVVRTPQAEVAVATGQPSRTLELPAGCPWAWYADREAEDRGLYSTGSVALVLLPTEDLRGRIVVSNYGVVTQLDGGVPSGRVRFALAAYPGPNPRAWQQFLAQRQTVGRLLKEMDFWPAPASAP